MKKMKKLLLLSLVGLGMSAASSYGSVVYNYSYTFTDGDSVSGQLTGTASGGTVDILSVLSLNIGGNAVNPLFVGTVNSSGNFVSGGATASLTDPTQNNFYFGDADTTPFTSDYFTFIPSLTAFPVGVIANDNDNPGGINDTDAQNVTGLGTWSLTAVPEPSTVIAGLTVLIPCGASTLRMLRKKQTA
jgi:hypothetical protein